jgi:hypothetical protein
VPQDADTRRVLRTQAQRSRRTVETAGRYAAVLITRLDGERLADNAPGLDPDRRGKDAGKVGVQRAAAVGHSGVIARMMAVSFAAVVMAVLMMVVRRNAFATGCALARGDETTPANCATTNRATSNRTNPRIVRNHFIHDFNRPAGDCALWSYRVPPSMFADTC